MKTYSERLPMIDELISEKGAKWPNGWATAVMCDESHRFSRWPPRRDSESLIHVCTPKEFETRAKELGWMNGYKYGVEYETNGEKPDLPDCVVVDIKTPLWEAFGGFNKPIHIWHWPDVEKFKVTDERYKPKKEVKLDESNWHERGELPPVGSHVDVVGEVQYGAGEEDCEVVAHVENCAVIRISYGLGCFAPHVLRPTRSERDKVIEAAGNVWQMSKSKCTHESFCTLIVDLHDAGMLKLPEGD